MKLRYGDYVYPLLTIVVILVAWELAARAGYFPRYILPAPSGIAVRFGQMHAFILKESELTPELLSQKIRDMIIHPEQLRHMSEKCLGLAPGDAASRVATTMEKFTQS